jgi:hypothetical protein
MPRTVPKTVAKTDPAESKNKTAEKQMRRMNLFLLNGTLRAA